MRLILSAVALLWLAMPSADAADAKAKREMVVWKSPCGNTAYPKDQLEAIRAYTSRVRAHVLSQMLWPIGDFPKGLVCVDLSVRRSGQVLSRKVVKSAGATLDRLALRMLQRVSSVPPLPARFSPPFIVGIPLNFR